MMRCVLPKKKNQALHVLGALFFLLLPMLYLLTQNASQLPDKINSDRGPQFASKAFTELLKLLGIKLALSMAYHPQTDRTMERVNQEIEAYLSIYIRKKGFGPEETQVALGISRDCRDTKDTKYLGFFQS